MALGRRRKRTILRPWPPLAPESKRGKQRAGTQAEDYVAHFLAGRSWRIVARNLRTPYGEIDLLALDPGGTLVAVEVKARDERSWAQDEEALRPAQRSRLARALEWCLERWPEADTVRLDLASVRLRDGVPAGFLLFKGVEAG